MIISHTAGCHFVLLMASSVLENLCSFMQSHLSIVDLRIWDTVSIVQEIFSCTTAFKNISYFLYYIYCSQFNVEGRDPLGIEFHAGW